MRGTAPIRGPRRLGDGEFFRLAAKMLSDSLRVKRDDIESLALGVLEREERLRAAPYEQEDTIIVDPDDAALIIDMTDDAEIEENPVRRLA